MVRLVFPPPNRNMKMFQATASHKIWLVKIDFHPLSKSMRMLQAIASPKLWIVNFAPPTPPKVRNPSFQPKYVHITYELANMDAGPVKVQYSNTLISSFDVNPPELMASGGLSHPPNKGFQNPHYDPYHRRLAADWEDKNAIELNDPHTEADGDDGDG